MEAVSKTNEYNDICFQALAKILATSVLNALIFQTNSFFLDVRVYHGQNVVDSCRNKLDH